MSLINGVANTNYCNNAEFVEIDIPGAEGSPFRFSSSYKDENFGGLDFKTFTALGGLVNVSGHQRDLQVTSYDTTITLVGIDQSKIGIVIDAGLKGAKVRIWRGFYDQNYIVFDYALRYTGIITSYSIQEDTLDQFNTFTLGLNCSSYKHVLETRIAGRFTAPSNWKSTSPGDTSMDRVASLNNAKFNFGQVLK